MKNSKQLKQHQKLNLLLNINITRSIQLVNIIIDMVEAETLLIMTQIQFQCMMTNMSILNQELSKLVKLEHQKVERKDQNKILDQLETQKPHLFTNNMLDLLIPSTKFLDKELEEILSIMITILLQCMMTNGSTPSLENSEQEEDHPETKKLLLPQMLICLPIQKLV